MKTFEEELIVKLGYAIERNKQIERNEFSIKNIKTERLLFTAMLADISDKLFGKLANKAPRLIAEVHGGWACGPGGPKEDECYVEFFYSKHKEFWGNDWVKEWKEFLEKISIA